MVNNIIYAAIGFVAGAITGGIIVGRVFGNDYSKRIESLDRQNRALTDELVAMRDKKNEETEKRIERQEAKLSDYNSLVKEYIPDEDDEDDFGYTVDTRVERIEIEDRSEEIKRIDEGRWNEELNFRQNEPLIYYQEDGTLTDDCKNIVHNPAQVVGAEIMDIIDETNNDYLYAVDEKRDMLYEIMIEHDASYTRDVLGCC